MRLLGMVRYHWQEAGAMQAEEQGLTLPHIRVSGEFVIPNEADYICICC